MTSCISLPIVSHSLLHYGHIKNNAFVSVKHIATIRLLNHKSKGKCYCYYSYVKINLYWIGLKFSLRPLLLIIKIAKILWKLLPYHRFQCLLKELLLRGEIREQSIKVSLIQTCIAHFPLICNVFLHRRSHNDWKVDMILLLIFHHI